MAHQLHYPFIFELQEKLTYSEYNKWLDYFNIANAESVLDALDDYFMEDIDELGRQVLKAMRNIQGKK